MRKISNKPNRPSKPIKLFGVQFRKPTFKDAVIAALCATVVFFLHSALSAPESGLHASQRWGSAFAAVLSATSGVQAFSSVKTTVLVIAAITLGGVVAGVIYSALATIAA